MVPANSGTLREGSNHPEPVAWSASVSSYAVQKGIAGAHFWSFDRDKDCAAGPAQNLCNSYGSAGVLGFTTQFLSQLKQ